MLRRHLLLSVAGTLAGAGAHALPRPPELMQVLPDAQLQGEARLRHFGLLIYDIRLWAPRPVGSDDWRQAPLALELVYARSLDGEDIARRSLEEMGRQGALADATAERWLAEMARLFPDVRDGDRLTGIQRPPGTAQFFYNGQSRGVVNDPDFVPRFFGIWLSAQTSAPALRERLLAGGR